MLFNVIGHSWSIINFRPQCAIEPYISPSQVVIPPPDPVPKDDFKERALMDMMDGVLEKLWHEEIKKPIPMPQCMVSHLTINLTPASATP